MKKFYAFAATALLSVSAWANSFVELSVGGFEFTPPAEVFVSPDGNFVNNFLLEVGGRSATADTLSLTVYSLETAYGTPPAGWLYQVTDGVNPALGRLFAVSGTPTNLVESGALQLAIWSVMGNMPGTIVDDLDGSWALAQVWLSQSSQSTALADYTLFDSKNYNQYVSLTPIPEPDVIALMLAGLGVVLLISRRRI